MGELNLGQYLSGTRERIEHLREVIAGRSVAILLPGHSINTLSTHLDGLTGFCLAAVNDFWVMENFIQRHMDIIMCSAIQCNVPSERHLEFLDRKDNVFITEGVSFHHSREATLEKYGNKILFFVAERRVMVPLVPTEMHPLHFPAQSSLSVLLSLVLIGKPKLIVLFGADGGGSYMDGWDSGTGPQLLSYDTETYNRTMPVIIQRVMKVWDVPAVPMLNCSPNSKYSFPNKISYGEFFEVR